MTTRMTVTEALKKRISIRQFLPELLPEALVREILDVARWAPSGGNLQAWRVIAVAREEREAVVRHAAESRETYAADSPDGRPVYPPNLWEPYRTRRYKLG